jgi:DNA-binding transcriptional ArsR family regulator
MHANKLKSIGGKLKVLSHPLNLSILQYLHSHGPVYVKKIYKELKIEQSVASIRLGMLRRAKLVKANKEDRKVFYTVNYEELMKSLDTMKNFFSEN